MDIRSIQLEYPRIIVCFEGLFHQEKGLHDARFAGAIAPGKQGERTHFDARRLAQGFEATDLDASDAIWFFILFNYYVLVI